MIKTDSTFSFETEIDAMEVLKQIECIGRTCYKSESLITDTSAINFVKMLVERGHEAMIEHVHIPVRIICDRGVTHEIVRHRMASYAQESTRYCNYSKDKFSNEITVIEPSFWEDKPECKEIWETAMKQSEEAYMKLIELGATPQEARSVLPNSLKTEIVVTMNLREWRHFFKLRTDKAAHPQIREIAIPLLQAFKEKIPVVFDNICAEN
jgi:thymidylate synthase (FAD)